MKRLINPVVPIVEPAHSYSDQAHLSRQGIVDLVYFSGILTFYLQQISVVDLTANGFLLFAVLIAVLFISEAMRRRTAEIFGPAAIVFYYMWFIGFGVPLAALLIPEAPQVTRVTNSSYYLDYVSLSLLAISGFALGARKRRPGQTGPPTGARTDRRAKQHRSQTSGPQHRLAVMAILLIGAFTLYLVALFLLGSIPTSYSLFKEWSANRMFVYTRYGFWFGSVILASVGNARQVRLGLILGSMSAVVLLITGNRNDVLYPLLISLCVYYMRLRRVPWKSVGAIFLAIMILGPIIAATREKGVSVAGVGTTLADSFAASLAELGAQARPVIAMFGWLAEGESYKFGGTYIQPALSMLIDFVSDSGPETVVSPYSLAARLPGLGFSMPGELYFNFGSVGVMVGYVMTGRLLLTLEDRAQVSGSYITYGFVCFSMLHLQRNSFGDFGVAVLLFVAVLTLEKWTRDGNAMTLPSAHADIRVSLRSTK